MRGSRRTACIMVGQVAFAIIRRFGGKWVQCRSIYQLKILIWLRISYAFNVVHTRVGMISLHYWDIKEMGMVKVLLHLNGIPYLCLSVEIWLDSVADCEFWRACKLVIVYFVVSLFLCGHEFEEINKLFPLMAAPDDDIALLPVYTVHLSSMQCEKLCVKVYLKRDKP